MAVGAVAGGRAHRLRRDHTSRQWQGYMNGAVESGARAARDIETMRLMQDVPAT
jgi:monoamine oxidase